MRLSRFVLLCAATLVLAACGGGGGGDAPDPQPPEPQKPAYPRTSAGDVTDTYFGRTIADPYRWLEDIKGNDTDAWVQAQNAFSASRITAMADYAALQHRIDGLIPTPSSPSTAKAQSVATQTTEQQYRVQGVQDDTGRFFFQYRTTTQTQRNDRRPGAPGDNTVSTNNIIYQANNADTTDQAQVLVDANQYRIDPDDNIELSLHQVTKDGKYLAYAMTRNYSDLSTLYVIDLQTGVSQGIRNVAGPQFLLSDDALYYARPATTEDEHISPHTSQSLYRFALDGTDNTLLFSAGEFDTITPLIIGHDWLYASVNTAMNSALARISLSTPADGVQYLLDGRAQNDTFEMMSPSSTNPNALLVRTTQGAGLYRLLEVDPDAPEPANWREILPNSPGGVTEYVNQIVACGDGYYAEHLEDGSSRLFYYPDTGNAIPRHEVPLPALGALSGEPTCIPPDNGVGAQALVAFSSLSTPPTRYRHDPQTQTTTLLATMVYPDFNPDDYETRRVMVASTDGVRIPVFIAHRKGLQINGDAPTLLYMYGGFRTAISPEFTDKAIPLLESGGIYVVAQVRGGAEYGNAWYDAGRLFNKQNTYDDVIAVASYLIDQGLTRPARLGLQGESNGGLTTAAVALQRPDLFGVVFPTVGVLDLLRYDQFTSGFNWLDDYGSNRDQAQFENKLKFSPLHQVKPQSYPPTYIFTGKTDGRVMPAHSYKYAATLQNTADGANPYLLYAFPKDGHSLVSHDRQFLTYLWTAFFHHVGVAYQGASD